jgi:transposase-like protein
MEFKRQFPDDDACLQWLWQKRYAPDGHTATCPKCLQPRRFHRLKKQPAYSCDSCGHHLHPTAGTIFHKSSTALWLWFYAMYLMTSTRCGLSAKQLERQIGVTYKTAWRMLNLIRNELMHDEGDSPLAGLVEIDETSVEGRPKARMNRREAAQRRERDRATVSGVVERQGRVRLRVLPSRRGEPLTNTVREHVIPEAVVYTDEWPAYNFVSREYAGHSTIRHSERIYVDGTVHTNTVEGFFGNLKTSLRGTYKHVSRKWLQSYLDEFAWRYNHRDDRQAQFASLVSRACEA